MLSRWSGMKSFDFKWEKKEYDITKNITFFFISNIKKIYSLLWLLICKVKSLEELSITKSKLFCRTKISLVQFKKLLLSLSKNFVILTNSTPKHTEVINFFFFFLLNNTNIEVCCPAASKILNAFMRGYQAK